ncbi:MAG: ParB/RepB/Spo0J family partition protein [Clostridia bacterium]|nr:ParB/RepB/Spo0J family partition protein [Clostridia bacterium]
MAKKVSRGITALLANVEDVREEKTGDEVVVKLPIERLKPNPNQPRKTFDPETIRELAASIKENGVIQPLVVKKDGEDYMIIAGERRYRASKEAGLSVVPAIVREMSEQKIREVSLIENLQREDLNAIEEAEAIAELIDSYNVTQEELSGKIGKSRSAISNSVRLLNLPAQVKEMLKSGALSAGHGRALLSIDDADVIIEVAKKAAA